MKKTNTSRRDFLKTSAVAASAIAVPYFVRSTALGAEGKPPASDRILLGAIGTGGKGMGDMSSLANLPEVQVVAVCDVDKKRVADAAWAVNKRNGNKDCFVTSDFREVLARPDVDIVTISTPDHWHGLIAIAAAKAGKDIYCQKPMVNTIAEGRAVVDAVRANKRILQVGSQERSGSEGRRGCELVRNGRIGKLQEIQINLPMDEGHHKRAEAVEAHPPKEAVPAELDYNMWLGHTPDVYYNHLRTHFNWRFNFNYGSGEMGDRGAHVIDLARLGADLDGKFPVEIEASGRRNPNNFFDVFWSFDFKNTFDNGLTMVGKTSGERGIKFVGDKGWLFIEIHGGKLKASDPKILEEKIGEDEIQLGRVEGGHYRNFLDSVKSRKDPIAPDEVGYGTVVNCFVNNIAAIVGRKLTWDAKTEKFVNDDEANKLLTPTMRAPWTLG